MKKIFLFATALSLMAFSCEKEEDQVLLLNNTCTVNRPLEELAWLKAEVQRQEQSTSDVAKYFYIQQAEYKQQTVFIYNSCCPMCSIIVPVYNCQGELLFYLSDKPEEGQNIKNTKVIWKPKNYACTDK
ncbi:hypothetical protein AAE02nite_11080 [Adhaeribacter aerolatus]|uniref:Lipoprotein n=1 Tax=Adhaeribacter aerolatus TaxID=670289 RepID=A0A512AUQ7_9BACT|nr:hypothetical protein [Adhaeribacter aerolatus]GEO03444.1 hypothetical protein AAE02nite_11080 [Adhaeribacter aerolatus]